MIGRLPTSLEINGRMYDIRTDYRDCLVIIQAFADKELTKQEQAYVLLNCLYKEPISMEISEEAYKKGIWFLDGGKNLDSNTPSRPPVYNFEQDEQMIFSAINKVAGYETRSVDYMHYWTFLGYFNEIGEGTFSTVVSIRDKKNRHKKLEKWEQDFYKNNKDLIDFKKTYTAQQEAERDEVRKLLGIK